MGIYRYVNHYDNYNELSDDPLQELFDEAKELDPSLLISEHHLVEKNIFGKQKWTTTYTVYHADKGFFQAREQMSGSGSKEVVVAYLYGIINGYNTAKNETANLQN